MADHFPPDEPAIPGINNSSSELETEEAAPEEPRLSPTTLINSFISPVIDTGSDDEDERQDRIMSRFINLTFDDFLRRRILVADDFPTLGDFILDYARHIIDATTSGVTLVDSTAVIRRNGGGGVFGDDPVDIEGIFGIERAAEVRSFIDQYRGNLLEYCARILAGEEAPPGNFHGGEPPVPIEDYDDSDTESFIRELQAEYLEDLGKRIEGMDLGLVNNPNAGGGGVGSSGNGAGGDQGEEVASTAAPENGNQQKDVAEEREEDS